MRTLMHRLFPVFFDTPDDGGAGGAPPEGAPPEGGETPAPDPSQVDLDNLSDEDWALLADFDTEYDPDAPLEDGVDTFDRAYVERVRRHDARSRSKLREVSEQFKDIDPQAAKVGADVVAQLQTQEGVVDYFYRTGHALGIPGEKLEEVLRGLVAGEPAGASPELPAELGDIDLDGPLTGHELMQVLNHVLDTKVLAPQAQQAEQQEQQAMTAAIDNAFTALELDAEADAEKRRWIVNNADAVAEQAGIDSTNPANVKAAIELTAQKFDEVVAEQARRLVAGKRAQAQGQPKLPAGGGSEGGGIEPDEHNLTLDEVIARRKERGRKAG